MLKFIIKNLDLANYVRIVRFVEEKGLDVSKSLKQLIRNTDDEKVVDELCVLLIDCAFASIIEKILKTVDENKITSYKRKDSAHGAIIKARKLKEQAKFLKNLTPEQFLRIINAEYTSNYAMTCCSTMDVVEFYIEASSFIMNQLNVREYDETVPSVNYDFISKWYDEKDSTERAEVLARN